MSEPHIVRLVLDRPDRANALDADTVEWLHARLAAADDAGADVVVLEARGRVFCSGLDLADLATETDASLLHRLVRVHLLLERISEARSVVVALVHGAAVGAGADLVLASHSRMALRGASLRFPGAGFGAVLGTARLAAETSPSYAAELGLTGRRVDRDEASLRGIWRPVVTPRDAEEEIARLATAAALLPERTGARLRAAAGAGSSREALGDLVRSLAGEPGLADRVRAYRTRTASASSTRPTEAPVAQGTRAPEGAPA